MQPLPQKPGWWRVNFHHDGSGPIERTVEFLNCPVEWADMIALARHCSTAPTSPFTFKRLCNLRVSDGYYALTDNELTISHGGVKEVRELTSNEEIAQVLDEYFNIGTGNGYSVLDIVNAYEKATGRKVPYQIVARRPGDIDACYADPTKAYETLGWKAEFGIEEMCRDSNNWQEKNPNGYGD
jgi:hypothetical protein